MSVELISYAVAALLAVAALMDCKTARIPNWLIGVMVALFVAKVIFFPQAVDILWQLVFAVCVLIGGFGLFATGGFGAGAVKLMAVTALFMPLDRLGILGLSLLAGIIISLFLFGFLRSLFGSEDSSWKVLRARVIPMAVPIGASGILGLFVL